MCMIDKCAAERIYFLKVLFLNISIGRVYITFFFIYKNASTRQRIKWNNLLKGKGYGCICILCIWTFVYFIQFCHYPSMHSMCYWLHGNVTKPILIYFYLNNIWYLNWLMVEWWFIWTLKWCILISCISFMPALTISWI
jgi:hypothetical protein